jgi:hypothetical protein
VKLQCRLRVTPGRFGEFTLLRSGARCDLDGDLHMKKQSQEDSCCPIFQLCKTNDTNNLRLLELHVNRKSQAILHVKFARSQRFWCGAPAALVMGFKLCVSLGIPMMWKPNGQQPSIHYLCFPARVFSSSPFLLTRLSSKKIDFWILRSN